MAISKHRLGFLVPINLTLATSMGLLIVVAVGVVFWIQWTTAQRNTRELVGQQVNLIAEKILQDLNSQLAPAVHLLDFIARNIEANDFEPKDIERLGALLVTSMAAAPQVFSVSFIDLNYGSVSARRQRDGSVTVVRIEREPDDILAAEIRDSLKSERPFWGNVVFSDGVTVVNRRHPVRQGGQTIGLLASTVSITRISELIDEFGKSVGGTGYVLYGKDRVLAHRTLKTVHKAQSGLQPLVSLGEIDDPVLRALANIIGAPEDVPQAFVGGFERRTIEVGGEGFVSFFRWIDLYGTTPWGIGAWLSTADVDVAQRRLLVAGYVGLVVLLISLAAAVVVGNSIARPIRNITASATKIGDFDLDDIDDLPPSRIKELAEQATAFNTMLAGLRSFETYVPRSLVTRLIREGGGKTIESQDKELTVMFTDIVGFTSISEGQPAGDVAELVNHHFAILGGCVEAEGGTIDKYIGDALMAFWGAPVDQEDTASRACRAATAMKDAVESDNRCRDQMGKTPTRIRIGIHTGPVLVGNIGAPGRVNYTIIGDTVNTCQRIEALGKQFDTGDHATILISDAVVKKLPAGFDTERVGEFELKGKEEQIKVHRLKAWHQ